MLKLLVALCCLSASLLVRHARARAERRRRAQARRTLRRLPRAERQLAEPCSIRCWPDSRGATSTSSSRTSRKARRTDPVMSPIAADLSRDDMIALGNFFAAQKPRADRRSRSTAPRSRRASKVSDAVLCPMCHLGGFVGQNEIPRSRASSRSTSETAAGLQGQAPHQRRRQHDERGGHAVRRGHRKSGAVHRQPVASGASRIAGPSHCRPHGARSMLTVPQQFPVPRAKSASTLRKRHTQWRSACPSSYR